MTSPDSVIALSQMLEDESAVTALTEHSEYLRTAEKELRANNDVEIRHLCKRGEIFVAAKKAVGHGNFLPWIDERRAAWHKTERAEGFVWSRATVQNYMNLYEWSAMENTTYHEYKQLGASLMYYMARGVLAGQEPEAVLDTLRQRAMLADGNDEQSGEPPIQQTASNGNGAKPYAVQTALAAYPALGEMVDRGDLHEQTAVRIAQAAEDSNDYRVKNAVAQFGANSAETVGSIASVARSMDKAIAEGFTVKDDIFQQLKTTGVIHTPMGDQIPLSEASPREVWGEYAMQRKETGASASAAKTVYRQEHTREAVLIFLEGAGETSYIPLIEHDAENQQYQITVRRLVAE